MSEQASSSSGGRGGRPVKRTMIVRPSTTTRVCANFHAGYCQYGERCRFAHEAPVTHEVPQRTNGQQARTSSGNEGLIWCYRPLCRYVEAGRPCPFEGRCNFYHPPPPSAHRRRRPRRPAASKAAASQAADSPSPTPATKPSDAAAAVVAPPAPRAVIAGPQSVFPITELTASSQATLRSKEIDFVSKRFSTSPTCASNGTSLLNIVFEPSDPDWPFDVRDVHLEVAFVADYPLKPLRVRVPEDERLPSALLEHIQFAVDEWLTQRATSLSDAVELVVRPFVHWFDKSARELFVNGLRKAKLDVQAAAAGLTFVRHRRVDESTVEEEVERCRLSSSSASDEDVSSDSSEDVADAASFATAPSASPTDCATRSDATLRVVELGTTIGTLRARTLATLVQCGRCRVTVENAVHLVVPTTDAASRTFSLVCSRCRNALRGRFVPQLIHEGSIGSGGSSFGVFELSGCVCSDVLLSMSEFIATCLECGEENVLKNLSFGQPSSTWCRKCHAKFALLVDGLRVVQRTAVSAALGPVAASKTTAKERVREPQIQAGQPLPQNGACRHYKKSYRWFRFPCCGKAFACDLCHDENESHEMKLANRVICGFCAKEQPFAVDRPCVACKSAMTKVASAHWEGGKGCRDPIKMRRSDRQKYKLQSHHNRVIAEKKKKPKAAPPTGES